MGERIGEEEKKKKGKGKRKKTRKRKVDELLPQIFDILTVETRRTKK